MEKNLTIYSLLQVSLTRHDLNHPPFSWTKPKKIIQGGKEKKAPPGISQESTCPLFKCFQMKKPKRPTRRTTTTISIKWLYFINSDHFCRR